MLLQLRQLPVNSALPQEPDLEFFPLLMPPKPISSWRRLAAGSFHRAPPFLSGRPGGRWAGGTWSRALLVPGRPARELSLCSGLAAPGARGQPVLAPASPRARGGPDGARRLALLLQANQRGPKRREHGTGPGFPLGPARARGFARPAPSPQRRRWALARGAWPWPGSPPQPEPPPPPQSVSQSVPSNGGRR